jgi:hypothetical protein
LILDAGGRLDLVVVKDAHLRMLVLGFGDLPSGLGTRWK